MTDATTTVDAVLWAAAVVLAGVAVWLSRPRASEWDADAFFVAALTALHRPSPAPITEGPVPAEGWDGDLVALGEEYDPQRRLGVDCTWDALAAWAPPVEAAVRRRLEHVTAVWIEEPPFPLPGVDVRVLPDPDVVAAGLEELCAAPERRLVFLARSAAGAVLRRLHAEPGLRDRTRAVVFVGADLAAEREWLAENFTHVAFDLELARTLPFFTLRVQGAGAQAMRPPPSAPRECLAVVDLGLVPPDALRDERTARALVVTLAAVG